MELGDEAIGKREQSGPRDYAKVYMLTEWTEVVSSTELQQCNIANNYNMKRHLIFLIILSLFHL